MQLHLMFHKKVNENKLKAQNFQDQNFQSFVVFQQLRKL